MASTLTDKQKRFCDEYLVDFNATQAAIRAGYSKKTANRIASENLSKPDIQTYIQSKANKVASKLEISQENTMREIARIAFADIRGLFKEDGSMKSITEIDDDTAAAIAGVETDELFDGVGREREQIGVTKKVKMNDKVRGLEMLAKHFGIYKDPENQPQKIVITIKK